jgi:DNA-binding NarL/FixJ family response regulator
VSADPAVLETIRVLIVDDHPVFRMGMSALLASLDGIEVVGEADSADGAVRLAHEVPAEVAMVDLNLGESSGIEATRTLTAELPDLAVLVVTMHDDEDTVVAAMRAGARGYVVKGAAPDAVERAVRAVAHGELILSPEIAAAAVGQLTARRASPFPDLTDRELEVLDLVARGLDNQAIARRLFLSPKTVRNHVSNLFTKLQVPDRPQAIVKAREAGLGESAPGE